MVSLSMNETRSLVQSDWTETDLKRDTPTPGPEEMHILRQIFGLGMKSHGQSADQSDHWLL